MMDHEDQKLLEIPDEIEITDLEPSTNLTLLKPLRVPRFTPRQRKFSLILTAFVFVLCLGLLLTNVSNIPGLLVSKLFPPTPIVSSVHGSFYLQSNPAWGQFSIDGKSVTHLPAPGHNAPLVLPPGPHQITWNAVPFTAQSCVLYVNVNSAINGSCFASKIISFQYYISFPVFTFNASLAILPVAQRGVLIQQINALITSATEEAGMLQTGEHYAVAQGSGADPNVCQSIPNALLCYTRASQPLWATLHLQAATGEIGDLALSACEPDNVCGDDVSSGDVWQVSVDVQLLWDYANASGQVVVSDQPASFIANNGGVPGTPGNGSITVAPDDSFVTLDIVYKSGHWGVQFDQSGGEGGLTLDELMCTQAAQDLSTIYGFSSNEMLETGGSGTNQKPGDGCLEMLIPRVSNATPPAVIGSACFLSRFGVLVAANPAAHKLLPYLPEADAYEQGLAQNCDALH